MHEAQVFRSCAGILGFVSRHAASPCSPEMKEAWLGMLGHLSLTALDHEVCVNKAKISQMCRHDREAHDICPWHVLIGVPKTEKRFNTLYDAVESGALVPKAIFCRVQDLVMTANCRVQWEALWEACTLYRGQSLMPTASTESTEVLCSLWYLICAQQWNK